VNGELFFSALDPRGRRARAVASRRENTAARRRRPELDDPQGLINAGGTLVFSARPNGETTDREVFR